MSEPFSSHHRDDLAELIAETPVCWIVPHAAPATAILMPVVLERDADGNARSLLGHLPLRAPATAALTGVGAAAGRASFLFLGPHGYIAPAVAGRSDWAPTWNFAAARITGDVAFDEALTRPALAALVDRLEGAQGWTLTELGARYDSLAARVIGFRADVAVLAPRFKLAQDETPAVRANIIAALAGTPLGRWMRRFDLKA